MSSLALTAEIKSWPMHEPFVIHGHRWDHVDVLTITLDKDVDGTIYSGRGEGAPVFYKNETANDLLEAVEEHRSALEAGVSRSDLASINGLDGGARNALDCALWDLEAKIEGKSIADLVGAPPLKPVPALVTVTLDTPEAMGAKAASYSSFPVLKLKLDGDEIVERVRAVRTARPDADIVIDANCAWDIDTLKSVADDLSGLGVKMVEQPLPASSDRDIDATFPFPLCADESCQTEDDLPSLVGKFQMINIKLDKCGGLTAALALADKAQAMGFDLMVGNMLGTSLAMAPSHVIAQRCAFADLDGPVSLIEDYPHGMAYDDAVIAPPTKDLWG